MTRQRDQRGRFVKRQQLAVVQPMTNPNHYRPDGTLTRMGELAARPPVLQPPMPPLPVPPPIPAPVPAYRLSLDQMIGIFFGCLVVSLTGITLHGLLIVGGLTLTVMGWFWLYRRAPITASIIFIVFGILLLAMLGTSGRGRRYRRRRW